MTKVLLEATGISKAFPGVQALSDVDFDLSGEEVHAIVGENGAGKSTFVKILTGILQPDEGILSVNGSRVKVTSPRDAERLGISAIQQELSLVPYLDVGQNVLLGRFPGMARGPWRWLGVIDRRELYEQAQNALRLAAAHIDLRRAAGTLGASERQLVLIARALLREMRILILDEPTAALTSTERDELFERILGLRAKGVGIIYISHHLDEVLRLADRITVFRDGRKIATLNRADSSAERVIELMLARSFREMYPKRSVRTGSTVLEVRRAHSSGVLNDVSLVVRSGEIVGITGPIGAGKSELARAIFGADPLESGEVLVQGKEVHIRSPNDAIQHGLALVPEDRKAQGLVPMLTVRDNMALPVVNARSVSSLVTGFGQLIRFALIERMVDEFVDRFRIHIQSIMQTVRELSGGNQQKVVLAKWLATRPRVIILDEPTRGLDVGSKVEIYRAMEALAEKGVGILMISSEPEEVVQMSDRVLVMRGGKIVAEFCRGVATIPEVLEFATGAIA